MAPPDIRRRAVLAVPVLVPASMAAVFTFLSRRLSPPTAYNIGFVIYWLVWCIGFPLWLLGPTTAARLLARGRRPSIWEVVWLLFPVAGAVGTQLMPNRRAITGPVATVMISTGAVNALAEELLWRGLFLHEFSDDVIRGSVWPLAGFSIWHLAPQIVLPSRMGRWQFVLGAALVGSASTVSVWRSKGLRNCLLPHLVTDACGVTAARFRLGWSDRDEAEAPGGVQEPLPA